MTSRRNFIKKAAMGTAAVSMSSMVFGKEGFSRILGSNDRVNFAIIGLGGRAKGLVKSIALTKNTKVTYICDVDSKRIDKFKALCDKDIGYVPAAEKDFRKVLEMKDVDAVVIVTPEHWHAPMSIMAMQAGKHVYVEKPCSHNPAENELLVAAQKKYNKVCQMGNQQRSSVSSTMAINDINEGLIGKAYMGKAWYSNARKSIGIGKEVPVPSTLDWELWQGPAPREKYRNNVHPYNWHWFKTWGTGEIHNNGTHEIDICRWALGVDYPTRVISSGGRLHFSGDDWEFFDTQMASYEFEGGKSITWEGRSCNPFKHHGRGRGVTIHGSKGTILLTRSEYILHDLAGKEIKRIGENDTSSKPGTADLTGFGDLTVNHMINFTEAIRSGKKLTAPIADAAISTHLCHLGNIAQFTESSLKIDSKSGKIVGHPEAQKYWGREYEKGWEPKI